MIKAVLLDLFGTTIAYGDTVTGTRMAWEGIHSVMTRLGATVPYEGFVPEWQRILSGTLHPSECMAATPFLSKICRLFSHYSLPLEMDAIEEAADGCLDGWDQHLELPPDTIPAIEAMRKTCAVALVSNFDHPPYVHKLLGRLGLTPLFDDLIISGEVGVDKPDPRIFQVALDALGVCAQEAVFVGDDLRTDIGGADAVGCRAVLIDRRGRHADYVGDRIESLDELLPLLSHSR